MTSFIYFCGPIVFLFGFTLADIAILTPDNKSVELFIDYKITYTPAIPEHGLIGLLNRASPADACSQISPPPNTSHAINWFVLADRSSYPSRCNNRDKIQHATQAGYKAIILYSPSENYLHSSSPYYPSLDHPNNTIPAVLVAHDDGEALRHKYLYPTGYKILITSDVPPNLSYYLLPFAIVIGVCLLLTISFMVFQLLRCIQERRKAQRYRLSKKYLKKLPIRKFEKGNYYETCAVCLDDYVDGEKIRILPCNHAYHSKCIDPWLTKNRRVCPVCKAKVRLPGMEESSDSDSDNDNRRTTSTTEDNERTQLIPSSRNSNRSRRELWSRRNLGVYIEGRSDSGSGPSRPHATTSSHSNQPIDDTYTQPGPSNSAPVISELTSNRSSNSRRNRANNSTLHVVAAEIAPLMAPPQLSINCDTDSEIPVLSSTNSTASSSTATTVRTGGRKSKRSSVDHIV